MSRNNRNSYFTDHYDFDDYNQQTGYDPDNPETGRDTIARVIDQEEEEPLEKVFRKLKSKLIGGLFVIVGYLIYINLIASKPTIDLCFRIETAPIAGGRSDCKVETIVEIRDLHSIDFTLDLKNGGSSVYNSSIEYFGQCAYVTEWMTLEEKYNPHFAKDEFIKSVTIKHLGGATECTDEWAVGSFSTFLAESEDHDGAQLHNENNFINWEYWPLEAANGPTDGIWWVDSDSTCLDSGDKVCCANGDTCQLKAKP